VKKDAVLLNSSETEWQSSKLANAGSTFVHMTSCEAIVPQENKKNMLRFK
jgi:hypothetical protein